MIWAETRLSTTAAPQRSSVRSRMIHKQLQRITALEFDSLDVCSFYMLVSGASPFASETLSRALHSS